MNESEEKRRSQEFSALKSKYNETSYKYCYHKLSGKYDVFRCTEYYWVEIVAYEPISEEMVRSIGQWCWEQVRTWNGNGNWNYKYGHEMTGFKNIAMIYKYTQTETKSNSVWA